MPFRFDKRVVKPSAGPPPPARASRTPRAATVLIVGLGVAALLAGVSVWHSPTWRPVAAIEARGGVPLFERAGPLWLHDLLGDKLSRHFVRVIGVTLEPPRTDLDADIQLLKKLPDLQRVVIASADLVGGSVVRPFPPEQQRKLERSLPNCEVFVFDGAY